MKVAIAAPGQWQWQWHDFCETQYASSLESGVLANFILCHQRVLAFLDLCEGLGILASASDPSGYREYRNLEKLVSYLNDSNMFIAASIGGLKDGHATLGYRAEAPILERADFEHLEAQERLQTPP